MIKVERVSILSGVRRVRDMAITPEQWFKYRNEGCLIQDCFPDLSADDREFILTGITPDEFVWEER